MSLCMDRDSKKKDSIKLVVVLSLLLGIQRISLFLCCSQKLKKSCKIEVGRPKIYGLVGVE